LTELNYDNIRRIWEREINSEELQDLDDLTVGKMAEYLSHVRLALTEVPADNNLQVEIYTREIENLEYMLTDLLKIRMRKILEAALAQQSPAGMMTIAEEEFYNRVSRGVSAHASFLESILTGSVSVDTKVERTTGDVEATENGGMEYVTVMFTRSIDTPFIGLDEKTYGPFEREDVATIPVANAQAWLRDGTVVRVVTQDVERD